VYFFFKVISFYVKKIVYVGFRVCGVIIFVNIVVGCYGPSCGQCQSLKPSCMSLIHG